MMVLFFLYLNLFCLSPDSNLDLLDQVIISPKLFSHYKKEAMDQLPDFSNQALDIQEHISKNCPDGTFFKTLSSLTVPLLLNEQAKSDIKTHILSQFQVYENPLKRHITIIGAGPIGLLTAIELGLRGHQITLIEKRPIYSRDRLFIDFHTDVFHFFEKFCPPHLAPQFNTQTVLIKHFEEWMFTVFQAIQQLNPSMKILYGTFIDYTFKNNQLTVFFEQDNKISAVHSDCLIGCDGAHSPVRKRAQIDGFYTQTNAYPDSIKYVTGTLLLSPISQIPFHTHTVWKGTYSQVSLSIRDSYFAPYGDNQSYLVHPRSIPLGLFGQFNSSCISYQHSNSYLLIPQTPVFLLGESLNTHGLGRSFFINASQLYNNLSLIHQYIELKAWKELHFLIQDGFFKPVHLLVYSRFYLLPTCFDYATILQNKLPYLPNDVPISEKEVALILFEKAPTHSPVLYHSDNGSFALIKLLQSLSAHKMSFFRINEILYIIIHNRVSYRFSCPSVIIQFIKKERTGLFRGYLPFILDTQLQELPFNLHSLPSSPSFNRDKSAQITTIYQEIKNQIYSLFPSLRPLLCSIHTSSLLFSS